MDTKAVTVVDGDGKLVPAIMIKCPDCGWAAFHILVIHGHNHLQCVKCDKSFCQNEGECRKQSTRKETR